MMARLKRDKLVQYKESQFCDMTWYVVGASKSVSNIKSTCASWNNVGIEVRSKKNTT